MNGINATKGQRPLNRKTLFVLAGVVLGLAGTVALWKYLSNSPRPWLVRWRVTRYLKKQSEPSDFKIDFPFPSRIEMAAKSPPKKAATEVLTKGKLTDKDFDSLKRDYIKLEMSALGLERKITEQQVNLKDKAAQLESVSGQLEKAQAGSATTNISFLESKAKYLRQRIANLEKKMSSQPELKANQEELLPIVSDLWDFQRAWLADAEAADATGASRLGKARTLLVSDIRQKLDEAATYADIYRAIGQELWVAARLLASAHSEHRRIGISLALQAGQNAQDDAQNGWLAGRICEGYVWPYLDVADDRNRRSAFNPENLVEECATIFRKNEEWQNVARTYELLLTRANTPPMADSARAQIARAYEQGGDIKRALEYLRAIKATNDFAGALRRIPRLERQLKAQ